MKMRSKKKPLLFLVLLLFVIFGWLTFFGDKGILHRLRLEKELARIKEANARMAQQQQRLKEEVIRLQKERKYIEEIARKELGMVKEGEIIYQFDTTAVPKENPK